MAYNYTNTMDDDKSGTLTSSGVAITALYTSIVKLTATAKTGYTFVGWFSAQPGTTSVSSNRISTNSTYSFTASSRTNIYALFAKNYTLTINYYSYGYTHSTNISIVQEDFNINKNIAPGESYTYTTYCRPENIFGFKLSKTSSYDYYIGQDSETTIETYLNSVMLYWETSKNTSVQLYIREQYKITYDRNGGEGIIPSSQVFAHSHQVEVGENTLYKIGYSPNGWVSDDGTHYDYGDDFNLNKSVILYADWKPNVYEITLENNNGSVGKIYLKYDNGWYKNVDCTQGASQIDVPKRTGYIYEEFTDASGNQTINKNGVVQASVNSITNNDTIWYAVWTAKNPAHQENGKWYVEMGYFPQSKVVNSTLKNNIKTSGTATGVTYSIAGQTLKEYKYGSDKYALYNGGYYKVEPVRYILQSSSDLKDGYATESGNVTAVSEKVVFASVWNEEYLGLGSGYLDSDLRTNFTVFREESGMVGDYTQNTEFQLKNFKNANGSGGNTTSQLSRGVSSESEIQSVFGDLSAEFSDLVADILGGYLFYWTRDVGSNLNNAQTISAGGVTGTQMNMQEILGVRVTINIKTLACE